VSEVIQFPTAKLEVNMARHFDALFARMAAAGLTPEQQMELVIQSAKEIGCVEIDGVWQLPPQARTGAEHG